MSKMTGKIPENIQNDTKGIQCLLNLLTKFTEVRFWIQVVSPIANTFDHIPAKVRVNWTFWIIISTPTSSIIVKWSVWGTHTMASGIPNKQWKTVARVRLVIYVFLRGTAAITSTWIFDKSTFAHTYAIIAEFILQSDLMRWTDTQL